MIVAIFKTPFITTNTPPYLSITTPYMFVVIGLFNINKSIKQLGQNVIDCKRRPLANIKDEFYI